jgi:hypothetical protein
VKLLIQRTPPAAWTGFRHTMTRRFAAGRG